MLRRISLDDFGVNWLLLALIPAPFMPEVGILSQILPFRMVNHWNGMTNIAAEWFTAGVMGRTQFPTIHGGDSSMEPVINPANIQHRGLHRQIVTGLTAQLR